MAKKLKVIENVEPIIKNALILQSTLAEALHISNPLFTKKMKRRGKRAFSVEEAQIIEKILKVKLTEPDNDSTTIK